MAEREVIFETALGGSIPTSTIHFFIGSSCQIRYVGYDGQGFGITANWDWWGMCSVPSHAHERFWRMRVKVRVIQSSFLSKIPDSSSCSNSWFKIHNGNSYLSSVAHTFCGSGPSDPMFSSFSYSGYFHMNVTTSGLLSNFELLLSAVSQGIRTVMMTSVLDSIETMHVPLILFYASLAHSVRPANWICWVLELRFKLSQLWLANRRRRGIQDSHHVHKRLRKWWMTFPWTKAVYSIIEQLRFRQQMQYSRAHKSFNEYD